MPSNTEMGANMRRKHLHHPVFYYVDHVILLIRAQHILVQLQTCSHAQLRSVNSMPELQSPDKGSTPSHCKRGG